MNEANRSFPHIKIKCTREGIATPPIPFPKSRAQQTEKNIGDRWGHGNKLKNSASGIVSDWQTQVEERKKEQKPARR